MVDKMLNHVFHHFRVGLLCVLSMAIGADGKLKSYAMLDFCGYNMNVTPQGMRLTLTNNGAAYPPDTDCSMALQVSTGNNIMLQFEKVNIKSCYRNRTIHCVDWLTVIDGDPLWGYPIVPGTRVCGNVTKSFSSTSHFFTLIFKSGNKKSHFPSTGFSVIVKPYHTGECVGDELLCFQNHRCIDFGLACNRQLYDTCGNGVSRPSDCYGFTSTTVAPTDRSRSTDYHQGVTTLVGISVGGGIILLLLVVIVVTYKRMRKRICGGGARRVISRSTRRAFRTRRPNSWSLSATGVPDCILATVTSASQPPPYSAVVGECEETRDSPYPEEPPPPYTEI